MSVILLVALLSVLALADAHTQSNAVRDTNGVYWRYEARGGDLYPFKSADFVNWEWIKEDSIADQVTSDIISVATLIFNEKYYVAFSTEDSQVHLVEANDPTGPFLINDNGDVLCRVESEVKIISLVGKSGTDEIWIYFTLSGKDEVFAMKPYEADTTSTQPGITSAGVKTVVEMNDKFYMIWIKENDDKIHYSKGDDPKLGSWSKQATLGQPLPNAGSYYTTIVKAEVQNEEEFYLVYEKPSSLEEIRTDLGSYRLSLGQDQSSLSARQMVEITFDVGKTIFPGVYGGPWRTEKTDPRKTFNTAPSMVDNLAFRATIIWGEIWDSHSKSKVNAGLIFRTIDKDGASNKQDQPNNYDGCYAAVNGEGKVLVGCTSNNKWTQHDITEQSAVQELEAGKKFDIRVLVQNNKVQVFVNGFRKSALDADISSFDSEVGFVGMRSYGVGATFENVSIAKGKYP